MLQKTRGIVFRYTRYGDTSIIVNIFTEAHGLQGYLVNGVRSGKNGRMALYQPLTLLDMVVYHREQANLMRIREVKCVHPYHSLHLDIRKSTIALFLTEMLNKVVREQTHTEELAAFLFDAFVVLDRTDHPENFHLVFLLQLSRYVGFEVQRPSEVLTSIAPDEVAVIETFLNGPLDPALSMSPEKRRSLLDQILHFYAIHFDTLGTIRSVEVLKEIFR